MRHLVITDARPDAAPVPYVVLGVLDTAAGPHPRSLDLLTVTRQEAETLGRLLERVRRHGEDA